MRMVNPVATIEPESVKPAPRLKSLEGIRLGLLHNNKMNGDKLLRLIAEELQRAHGVGSVHLVTKYPPQKPARKEMLDAVAAQSDAVLNAIGD